MSTLELYPGMQVLVIEDQPHPLEEELQGAVGDGDNDLVMEIFVDLYKEDKQDEIKYILSRHYLFNEQQADAALERIKIEYNL